MDPITRQEQLLNSIATGDSAELEPITREEMYLSAIAGSTESKPEKPITRKEMFYEKIIESGGVGGDGTAKPEQTKIIEVTENGTYKITPDSGKVLSSATAKVNVPERYDEGFAEGKEQGLSQGYASGFGAGVNSVKLQEKTATENGDVLPDEGFNGMKKVTVAVPTGSGKEEQEKSITITQNGTTEVTPDEGKTLSKVTVETNVAGDGGSDENLETLKAVVEGGADVILPDSVTKIRDYLFYNNSSIVNFKAKGVTDIGKEAFVACQKLATVDLSENVTRIQNSAFFSCFKLNFNKLPAGLIEIGDKCFRGCTLLTLTELPDNITVIGIETFRDCKNLALTELPARITIIGTQAFYNCIGLITITFKGTPTTIKSSAFSGCTNLTTINVPWSEGAVANAPWGATNATINYNYTGA